MSVEVLVEDFDLQPAISEIFKDAPYWIAEFVLDKTMEGFFNGTDPWGAPWAPLAKSTIDARRRRGNAGISPLLDTGQMFASLRVERGNDFAVIHMDSPAGFHQGGTRYMPAREMLPMEGEEVVLPDSWTRDLATFLASRVAGVG